MTTTTLTTPPGDTTQLLSDTNTTTVVEELAPQATVSQAAALSGPTRPSLSTAAPNSTPHQDYRGFAISSFVLGLVSILSSGFFIAPIVGLVLGIIALRRNSADRQFAIWGVALSGATLVIGMLVALFFMMLVFIELVTFGA